MPTHGSEPLQRRSLGRTDSDTDQRDPSDLEERNARIPRAVAQAPPRRTRDEGVGLLAGVREPLALSVEEAAAAIGVARSTFYVKVLPELERWLERSAAILPRHA
jgi:hypothetical protein